MYHILHLTSGAKHKPLSDRALLVLRATLSALAPYAIAAAALFVYHEQFFR